MAKAKKGKKLSQRAKDELKENYSFYKKKANYTELTPEEKRYINAVKASKAANKKRKEFEKELRKQFRQDIAEIIEKGDFSKPKQKSIDIDGKRYRNETAVQMIEEFASAANKSLKDYVKENKDNIKIILQENGVRNSTSAEKIFDIVEDKKRGKFFINDGNGLVKVGKTELLLQMKEFQNFIASNTKVVYYQMFVNLKFNDEVIIEMPTVDEFEALEDADEDEILKLMKQFNISYIVSDPNRKKK